MDRERYLRETSDALREAENRRPRSRSRVERVPAGSPVMRALMRFAAALGSAGFGSDGSHWQCPSCRSQGRPSEFCLEVSAVGQHVEFRCAQGCRPNTIRALLGAPAHFPSLGRGRTVGRHPFR